MHWKILEFKTHLCQGFNYGTEDYSIIPTLQISNLGEGNGNPLQYSCLENPMDGGAW